MNFRFLFIAIALLTLSACGDSGSSAPPEIKEYVIKGDPDEFIAGATLDTTSPYNADNVQQLSNYSLISLIEFAQKGAPDKYTSKEELQEKNSNKETDTAPERKTYRLNIKPGPGTKFIGTVENLGAEFEFTPDNNGHLQLTQVKGDKQTMAVRTLHWSQTPDKSTISILFSYENADSGKGIAAIYFKADSVQKKIPLYDKVYQYLAGAGVGIAWNQEKTLTVKSCGANVNEAWAKIGVEAWSKALGNRLKLSYEKSTTYAPFSDLNQRCIYALNIYDKSPGNANLGTTPSILDLNSGEIIDSDVIIFNAAFKTLEQKYKDAGYQDLQVQSALKKDESITYTHELGHLLGLHHKFDGTQSIMSYDFNTTVLTNYDIKAIQTLYPRDEYSERTKVTSTGKPLNKKK
ncbi:hypothetical protein AZI86_00340 [Bdellovibrio bacteriovorus]|uniref:Peptidase M10 metallopeptidase domain-containing protein n=1 Tax=Bdellovibrio bacteriovorus TaxID=959 RepID=A0A150WMG6_BDEBC|nr:matrixin family metalloprotease [Bdellovibrio bacteriovorus]KYG65564.1 hypothetical protein AZI86_00340 [Bdellovibrio bacteriovorus]